MGLLGSIKKFAPAIGGIAGGLIGGPGGAATGAKLGGIVSSIGGSRGGSRAPRGGSQGMLPGPSRMPSRQSGVADPQRQRREFELDLPGFNLPFGGGGIDLGGIRTMTEGPQPSGSNGGQSMTGGGGALPQAFSGALGAAMLEKSVRSKSGRSILEAMQSGALQDGMIQQTVTVRTPRGTEQHSPPGFRTVRINGQPFAVFKPLAQALRLLPKKSRAVLTSADKKAIRTADRLTKKVKKLAQDTGRLKVTNK